MTFTINIENGTSIYTAEDLIRYNDAGLLYCGDVCLSSVIDKIVEYYESNIEQDKENVTDSYQEGYDEGYRDAVGQVRGFVNDM